MEYFCTYFDSNYLVRGLTMIRSLRQHLPGARIWVLCLDNRAEQILKSLAWDEISPVSLDQLEIDVPELAWAKKSRTRVEYFFTLTPCWIKWLLDTQAGLRRLTYLDSDLFFYSSPIPLYEEMSGYSLQIMPHRFPERLKANEAMGRFNVSWIVFNRDAEALKCVAWWKQKCLEWCFDRIEPDRYADQKYLDQWPGLFEKVHISTHPGANLAPWNLENYQYQFDRPLPRVNGADLIFYHFQGYKQISPHLIDPGINCYGWVCPKDILRNIHRPYIQALENMRRTLKHRGLMLKEAMGNTRAYLDNAFSSWSGKYKLRVFLEGRAMGLIGGYPVYCQSAFFKKCLAVYDGLKKRPKDG